MNISRRAVLASGVAPAAGLIPRVGAAAKPTVTIFDRTGRTTVFATR